MAIQSINSGPGVTTTHDATITPGAPGIASIDAPIRISGSSALLTPSSFGAPRYGSGDAVSAGTVLGGGGTGFASIGGSMGVIGSSGYSPAAGGASSLGSVVGGGGFAVGGGGGFSGIVIGGSGGYGVYTAAPPGATPPAGAPASSIGGGAAPAAGATDIGSLMAMVSSVLALLGMLGQANAGATGGGALPAAAAASGAPAGAPPPPPGSAAGA